MKNVGGVRGVITISAFLALMSQCASARLFAHILTRSVLRHTNLPDGIVILIVALCLAVRTPDLVSLLIIQSRAIYSDVMIYCTVCSGQRDKLGHIQIFTTHKNPQAAHTYATPH
jgi:hypothetical protein